jgi:hypothetical protein
MSHSTHVGFNAPLSSVSENSSRSLARAPDPPHLHIADPPLFVIAVGVGSRVNVIRTAFSNPTCRFFPSGVMPVLDISPFGLRPPFGTFGVGHIRTAVANPSPLLALAPLRL